MSYLDSARKALEKVAREADKTADLPQRAFRKPWNLTPEEEATICRAIERDQGLLSGSVRLYTQEEFRRLFNARPPEGGDF